MCPIGTFSFLFIVYSFFLHHFPFHSFMSCSIVVMIYVSHWMLRLMIDWFLIIKWLLNCNIVCCNFYSCAAIFRGCCLAHMKKSNNEKQEEVCNISLLLNTSHHITLLLLLAKRRLWIFEEVSKHNQLYKKEIFGEWNVTSIYFDTSL